MKAVPDAILAKAKPKPAGVAPPAPPLYSLATPTPPPPVLKSLNNLVALSTPHERSLEELRQAVQMRNDLSGETLLEASGGVTSETLTDIGRTGIDRVSVGALTHSAINLDLGLDWL